MKLILSILSPTPCRLTLLVVINGVIVTLIFLCLGEPHVVWAFLFGNMGWLMLYFAERKIERLEASRLKHIDFLNSRYTSGPAGRTFPRS